MQKTIVVAVCFGIGKHTFIDNHKRCKIVDIQNITDGEYETELSKVRDAVKRGLKYAFVPVNEAFLRLLDNKSISFYIVMPEKTRKTEIIQSYYNDAVFEEERDISAVKKEVAEMQSQWNGLYRDMERYAAEISIQIMFLKRGEYLTQAMKTIEQLEKENG